MLTRAKNFYIRNETAILATIVGASIVGATVATARGNRVDEVRWGITMDMECVEVLVILKNHIALPFHTPITPEFVKAFQDAYPTDKS